MCGFCVLFAVVVVAGGVVVASVFNKTIHFAITHIRLEKMI